MSNQPDKIAAERAPRGALSGLSWNLGDRVLQPGPRPLVMGILNLTPDSFHAGSRQTGPEAAACTAQAMAAAGADALDLGAESTRPGSAPVSAKEEMDRLLPALEAVRRVCDLPLTVDTYRAATARAALAAGADAVNDISAGSDPDMFPLCAEQGCGLILMHMRGTPRTMQEELPEYDAFAVVDAYLQKRCALARRAGIAADHLMVDPGIGFGKTLQNNLDLLRHLAELGSRQPLLLGASRKSFIGQISGAEAADRLPGSLAALTAAHRAGSLMVRVHDVAETVQFLDVLAAISS